MGDLDLQIFSDRLKKLRASLNLTQIEFVEGLGITAAALSAYENNIKNPSISVAKRIAEKYNISIDWLCGLSDKKTVTNELEKMSDIINLLFSLEDYLCIDTLFDYPSNISSTVIIFKNPAITDFINRWKKMKDLYEQKLIDIDVYHLWKEKEMISFSASGMPDEDGVIPFLVN